MQFQSARIRWFIRSLMLVLIVDVAVAALLVHYGTPDNDYWPIALAVALGVMWALALAFWLKRMVIEWIEFMTWGRALSVDALHQEMEAAGMARYPGQYANPREYFGRVIEDEDAPMSARLKAASLIGFLNYPAMAGRMGEAFRLTEVAEKAINKL